MSFPSLMTANGHNWEVDKNFDQPLTPLFVPPTFKSPVSSFLLIMLVCKRHLPLPDSYFSTNYLYNTPVVTSCDVTQDFLPVLGISVTGSD